MAHLSRHLDGSSARPAGATGEDRLSIAGAWLSEARQVLDRIEATQMPAIAEAATLCARAIGDGGLVHLFGTGHSRIPLEEMFPRYGSYPGFHPIAELSMTFHTQVVGANGQRQAMFIERTEGLAEVILANFQFGPTDVMLIFSASGLTAVPIEMAIGARARGLPVVAVTSVAQSMAGTPGPPERDAPPRPRRHRHRPVHPGRRRARPAATAWTRRSARARPSRTPRSSTSSRSRPRRSCSSGARCRRSSRAGRSSGRSARRSCSRPPTASTPGGSPGPWPARRRMDRRRGRPERHESSVAVPIYHHRASMTRRTWC